MTITKLDGLSVKGQFISADPRQVTLALLIKPGVFGEHVTTPWKEIKQVSNGLTHKKVLAEWKKDHPDQLCTACHGDLTVPCATCKGTGHDPAAGANCATCSSELLVEFKVRCDQGKVSCPAPCIRLSQGNWVKKADGLRWKRIPVGKGFAEISERHLGEIIVVNPDGSPDFRGKCPTCAGTEKADCAVCHGTTKTACPECTHRADAPACPSDCENGRTPCEVCEGVGLKK